MSNWYHHLGKAGREEVERLYSLMDQVCANRDAKSTEIKRLRAALRYYMDDGAHSGEIARRALEQR